MKEISRLAEDELARRRRPGRRCGTQFAGWVQQEVAAAASANFIWATQRVRALAKLVAEHFADDRDAAAARRCAADPSDAIRSVRAMTAPAAEAQGAGHQGADRAARRLHAAC